MLGQFFEFSLAARPVAQSFEFYAALGLGSISVGDAPHAPAAAFYDGAVTLGIHDADPTDPLLTFVRPQLKDHVRGLRRLGIEVEHAKLADDGFHEVRFADPDGQTIRLLEARTFSPGTWDERNVTASGVFLEYSISSQSIKQSRAFWEPLGFALVAAGDAPHSWLRLAGHGLTLGLHEARFRSGLRFRAPNVSARSEYLKAKGVAVRAASPLAAAQPSATLVAPEGTALYLLEES
jgi:catechol 2,3-dioxygenase-like lactoylglutathione lyase family enzyme